MRPLDYRYDTKHIVLKLALCSRKLKRDSMGNNNEVVITDTDRLLLQKDEEVGTMSL